MTNHIAEENVGVNFERPDSYSKTTKENIREALKRLGTLPEEALISYALKMEPFRSREGIRYAIDSLELTGGITRDGYSLAINRGRKPERDMSIAFWVFTEYAAVAATRFIPADWPSSILFGVEDEVTPYRITVCFDPQKDGNLSALKEKRWDGHFTEIIAGVNIKAEDIAPELLPDSTVIFAEFEAERPLIDIPKISFRKIREENSEE